MPGLGAQMDKAAPALSPVGCARPVLSYGGHADAGGGFPGMQRSAWRTSCTHFLGHVTSTAAS